MNALQTIQQKLKAPKGQFNAFGKYHYRNQEDILEAVKPLLAETKSTLILSDDVVEIGGSLFVKATAILKEEASDTVVVTAYAKHDTEVKGMASAQVTGAASSYARKYALNGLFLIDDNKDADSTNDGTTKKTEKTPTTPAKKLAPSKELEWLNPGTPNWSYSAKRIREGVTIETIKKSFRISKTNEDLLIKESKNEDKTLA